MRTHLVIWPCLLALLLAVADGLPARGDMVGPTPATQATSPDGNLLVRIKRVTPNNGNEAEQDAPRFKVSYYAYHEATDTYAVASHFTLTDRLGQMLYVSNAGDLVMITLGRDQAIRLYTRQGQLAKAWDLADFLSKREIRSCAATGSTLQWFNEGLFYDRKFYVYGPSQWVRALPASFTLMRGVDPQVTFSATIDAATAELTKRTP